MTMKQDQVARVATANKGAPVSAGWSLPRYHQRVVAGEGGGLVLTSARSKQRSLAHEEIVLGELVLHPWARKN